MKEEGGTLLGEKGVRRHQVSSQTRTMLRKKAAKRNSKTNKTIFFTKKRHTLFCKTPEKDFK